VGVSRGLACGATLGLALLAGGCAIPVNPDEPIRGPRIAPRVTGPDEGWLARGPEVVLWNAGGRLQGFVRVTTAYGSGDDGLAELFRPRLTEVRVDGRRMKTAHEFAPENDARSRVPRDGGSSELSGWGVSERFSGRGSAAAARSVAAAVCWPGRQGCARVTFSRCRDGTRLVFGPRLRYPVVDSRDPVREGPVGTRIFYGLMKAGGGCGALRVERLH
jgi:hypothetical protein